MKYIGSELEIFREATNWKSYWASQLSPFLRGSVLEVGAGIGGSTRALLENAPQSKIESWTCLEPDPELFKELEKASSLLEIQPSCQQGFLNDIPAGKVFDTILYLDVLEHIEDHEDELARAAKRLDSGGSLVVLVPAHDFLFSEFDRSIGHFRRYSKSTCFSFEQICFAATLSYKEANTFLGPSFSQIFPSIRPLHFLYARQVCFGRLAKK